MKIDPLKSGRAPPLKSKNESIARRTWLGPRLVHVKEVRLASASDARAVRRIHDGAVGADDVHHAAVFQRALFRFVRLQALGVPGRDVAPQSLRGRRAELGRDARPWVLQERQYRGCALKGVACGVRKRQKL